MTDWPHLYSDFAEVVADQGGLSEAIEIFEHVKSRGTKPPRRIVAILLALILNPALALPVSHYAEQWEEQTNRWAGGSAQRLGDSLYTSVDWLQLRALEVLADWLDATGPGMLLRTLPRAADLHADSDAEYDRPKKRRRQLQPLSRASSEPEETASSASLRAIVERLQDLPDAWELLKGALEPAKTQPTVGNQSSDWICDYAWRALALLVHAWSDESLLSRPESSLGDRPSDPDAARHDHKSSINLLAQFPPRQGGPRKPPRALLDLLLYPFLHSVPQLAWQQTRCQTILQLWPLIIELALTEQIDGPLLLRDFAQAICQPDFALDSFLARLPTSHRANKDILTFYIELICTVITDCSTKIQAAPAPANRPTPSASGRSDAALLDSPDRKRPKARAGPSPKFKPTIALSRSATGFRVPSPAEAVRTYFRATFVEAVAPRKADESSDRLRLLAHVRSVLLKTCLLRLLWNRLSLTSASKKPLHEVLQGGELATAIAGARYQVNKSTEGLEKDADAHNKLRTAKLTMKTVLHTVSCLCEKAVKQEMERSDL
ncbi:uncharacterized protein L969DRAFT_92994 [Mixia osmundae IAM 14324]|uniref:Uncharacterized protein n=1 Tax=Mixia osmundae (strain CBS 9802 / IAM 14324 / JCM 22182 / KY 12970) TaxID=764103 RepID=G7DU04_MIXOS|nr:uncharacterized protein L969DRAFT_92994 [Mixia osmundae IAM 14324]KEI41777.1 hypothetical protein L969DRAFT_92994 [Mixia osmundae IAM 14324]GAA94064.1 hypothetical protein E5Q_00711 [Mixia osmundae IAM 14324]